MFRVLLLSRLGFQISNLNLFILKPSQVLYGTQQIWFKILDRVRFRVDLGLDLIQGCPVPSHYLKIIVENKLKICVFFHSRNVN